MSWLKELQKELQETDKVPPGWKTVKQWAKEDGLSVAYTAKLLDLAVIKGRAERHPFRILMPSGMVRTVPHYRRKA